MTYPVVSGIEDWKKVDDFFWEKKRLLGDQSRTRIPARQDGHDDSVSRQDGTLHAEFRWAANAHSATIHNQSRGRTISYILYDTPADKYLYGSTVESDQKHRINFPKRVGSNLYWYLGQ
jgi:hypothetical protein